MLGGVALFAILIQLSIFVGVIVFAVKVINRLQEISDSQASIALSQMKMLELLADKNKVESSSLSQSQNVE